MGRPCSTAQRAGRDHPEHQRPGEVPDRLPAQDVSVLTKEHKIGSVPGHGVGDRDRLGVAGGTPVGGEVEDQRVQPRLQHHVAGEIAVHHLRIVRRSISRQRGESEHQVFVLGRQVDRFLLPGHAVGDGPPVGPERDEPRLVHGGEVAGERGTGTKHVGPRPTRVGGSRARLEDRGRPPVDPPPTVESAERREIRYPVGRSDSSRSQIQSVICGFSSAGLSTTSPDRQLRP